MAIHKSMKKAKLRLDLNISGETKDDIIVGLESLIHDLKLLKINNSYMSIPSGNDSTIEVDWDLVDAKTGLMAKL